MSVATAIIFDSGPDLVGIVAMLVFVGAIVAAFAWIVHDIVARQAVHRQSRSCGHPSTEPESGESGE